MKSLTLFFVSLFLLLFIPHIAFANVFFADSVEYRQPNDVTFIGREWGDEFLYFMETDDSYRFVQGENGWYYYAILSAEGKFVPSANKVAIDPPPAESYQLSPSADYLDQIEQEREEARGSIEEALLWFKQKQAEARTQGKAVTLKIGILLAEFTDFQHFTSDPSHPLGNYVIIGQTATILKILRRCFIPIKMIRIIIGINQNQIHLTILHHILRERRFLEACETTGGK